MLPEPNLRHLVSSIASTLGLVCVCVFSWSVYSAEMHGKKPSLFLSFQDLAFVSIVQLLGSTLRQLDLTSCICITDLSVRAISTYLQGLVVLRLACCKEVTDWGLLGMVEAAKYEPKQLMVRATHRLNYYSVPHVI